MQPQKSIVRPSTKNERTFHVPVAGQILKTRFAASLRLPGPGTRQGLGWSAALHAALVLALSLLVLQQQTEQSAILAMVRFDDQHGSGENLLLTPELELPIPETRVPQLQLAETLADHSGLPLDSELKMDFSQFASSAADGSSSTIAEAAAGIQDRVQKAGGKTGEVQFSLAWHSFNDLDLHVITPSGEHIGFRNKSSRCRGLLDVDMNVQPTSESPVENVRWLSRSAPMGRFTVLVHQYQWRNGNAVDDFQLLVSLGDEVKVIEGQVRPGASVSIHRFHYVRSSLSASRQQELSEELSRLQQREESQAGQMLQKALPMDKGRNRDQQMGKIILQFPHTDAALRAMQELHADPKE